MPLIQESFRRLFPEKEFNYQTYLEYNRRLSDFNANIKLTHNRISLHLNLQWKDIDDEIKIGLIQTLLLKIFKKRAASPNIELYHNFIKNIPILTEKNLSDPELDASFLRVNQNFFDNLMEKPNLEWGTASRRKLGSYNFHNDTITVSTLFQSSRPELLDYLMYHELLHKQHKFRHKNGTSFFHTRDFRRDENNYPDKAGLEREISTLIRKRRLVHKKTSFWNFFR